LATSSYLNNLAYAVYARYDEQLGSMEDLDEIITYHREALALRPPGQPDRSMSLSNLACAILARYDEQLSCTEDLEEVITYHREALALCLPGHPDRSKSLNNLAISVLARCDQSDSMEDLEEVITYLTVKHSLSVGLAQVVPFPSTILLMQFLLAI
jgi:tetratricopeptide (TPR) repeat protein